MTTASAGVALKGLVPLLEAVAKVRTERDAELVVVGKPRDGSSIPATVERLGLEGAVRFVSGVDPARMVELYAEAEVAVVPSLYEGFSLPAVEAMSSGVPLVATTGGALPEVVGRDGETALLVPPNDPGALAVAIGRVLDDPALAERLAEAGRARVLEKSTLRARAELLGNARSLPVPVAVFERVVAAEALEHTPRDKAAMAERSRVRRPGGTMAVTVPRWYPELINWALSDEYRSNPEGHIRIYRRS